LAVDYLPRMEQLKTQYILEAQGKLEELKEKMEMK
jgi:hypothetical protein